MVWLIVVGIVIYSLFLISRRLLRLLSIENRYRKSLQYWFPLLEFGAWGAFIFWGIHLLYRNRFFYEPLVLVLVIILTLLLTWYFLKDLVAGIIFKAENNFKANDKIRFEQSNGSIRKLGNLTMHIENEAGEIEIFAYSRVLSKNITKINPGGLFKKYVICPHQAYLSDVGDEIARLKALAWSAPWSSTRNEPLVTKSKNEQQNPYEVTVYALNADHAEKIKMHIEKRLESSGASKDKLLRDNFR